MLELKVVKNRCPENHACPSVRICPVGALSQEEYKAPDVNQQVCIKCGKCARFCPYKALVLD